MAEDCRDTRYNNMVHIHIFVLQGELFELQGKYYDGMTDTKATLLFNVIIRNERNVPELSQYFFILTNDITIRFAEMRLDCGGATVNEGFVAVLSTRVVA